MTNLLAGLVLASASFGLVMVAGAVLWCWMNRSRLYNRKPARRLLR